MDRLNLLKIANEAIDKLEPKLTLYHDASEHRYEESPDKPGVCEHCGWFNIDPSPHLRNSGRSPRHHAENHLLMLKSFREFLQSTTNQEMKFYSDHIKIFLTKIKAVNDSLEFRNALHFPFPDFPTISLN